LTRQVHELKGTVARLEMRIRALESEKGGMALEKGGLADQLAKLDADFRALEGQLSDTRNACLESKERESQLQALLKALQV
jgi:chromosome segregation ATPase